MRIKFYRRYIPFLIIVFFGSILFAMGILNHYFFRTLTYDYGNYNFAFWDYSHFRLSPIPTFRGNFLQDHFSFTLMYFIPVYWLLNWLTHTYTLIIIQNALILVAAWYTYKIIRLKSDNLWLGAGVLVYYFVLLGRYTAFAADVNLAIISSCFIPIFIYYFKIRKYLLSLIILILSLLSRENIPLWFIFIFITLIIDHKREKKAVLYSLTGITISIVYFIVLFKILIPSIETPGLKYALFNYSALGATPGEAFLYIINHPVESIKLFFVNHLNNPAYDGVKAEFYWVYLISGGFILLIRPQYLIWFIPIVAQKVLNDAPTRWGIATYYSLEVVTLLPLSVFLALSSLKLKKIQVGLVIIICIATTLMTVYKLEPANCKIPGKLNPSKSVIYSNQFYDRPFNIKKVNKLLKQIPPKAKVSASNILLPHLAQREKIYFFPKVKDAEYVVFSVFDNNYLHTHTGNEKNRNKYFTDPNWEIIAQEFPVFLFKLNKTSNKITNNKLWAGTDTLMCDYENINSTNEHKLLSNKEKKETVKFLTNEKSLSGSHSIKITPEDKYSTRIYIKDIDINKINYLQISVWGYSSEKVHIHLIADYGTEYHFHSNESDTINSVGWEKLILNFWVPQNSDNTDCSLFLMNSGSEAVYFDDLQIIKKYK